MTQWLGVANDVFNGVNTLDLIACHTAFGHRYSAYAVVTLGL
jgi:hypothetical protein